jgi:hypothetical protein
MTHPDVRSAMQLMAAVEAEVQFGAPRPPDHPLRRRVSSPKVEREQKPERHLAGGRP